MCFKRFFNLVFIIFTIYLRSILVDFTHSLCQRLKLVCVYAESVHLCGYGEINGMLVIKIKLREDLPLMIVKSPRLTTNAHCFCWAELLTYSFCIVWGKAVERETGLGSRDKRFWSCLATMWLIMQLWERCPTSLGSIFFMYKDRSLRFLPIIMFQTK